MHYNCFGDFMINNGFVPEWILNSKTDITEQNNEVGLIVAGYIGAFNKRGFSQKQIGCMLSSAFLLDVKEVEKRLDALLDCGEGESVKNLCVFAVEKGGLFSADGNDPCEIIDILKVKYGKNAVVETILTFPLLLSCWKTEEIRDLPENADSKKKAQYILNECASVFEEV